MAGELIYLTAEQLAVMAAEGEDLAVRVLPDSVAGDAEVLRFLPSEDTWKHESVVLDAGGGVVSRTTIEEPTGEITEAGEHWLREHGDDDR